MHKNSPLDLYEIAIRYFLNCYYSYEPYLEPTTDSKDDRQSSGYTTILGTGYWILMNNWIAIFYKRRCEFKERKNIQVPTCQMDPSSLLQIVVYQY